ncbi:hypothetical protein Tco_1237577 [Tanacetum coccineum]
MSRKRVLTLDKDSESIDSTKYRGMIGSLLYLTASRSNIMFSVYFCARFQEDPKISHLEAVKRIFRYIKGTQHLGLWYPKDTGDHKGAKDCCQLGLREKMGGASSKELPRALFITFWE